MSTLQDLIYPAVDEFQSQLERPLPKSPDTALLGPGAALDSLLFVSFLLALEEKILAQTGRSVTLAGEKAMTMKESPFRSFATLASFIDAELALAA